MGGHPRHISYSDEKQVFWSGLSIKLTAITLKHKVVIGLGVNGAWVGLLVPELVVTTRFAPHDYWGAWEHLKSTYVEHQQAVQLTCYREV